MQRLPATSESWSAAKVARELNRQWGCAVPRQTVRKWCNEGLLPGAELKPCTTKTGVRDCWYIPKKSVATLREIFSQVKGDARQAAIKLREERLSRPPILATAPATTATKTRGILPGDRAKPGRVISDTNKKIYRTCNEMHSRAKAGEFKMRVAVAKVLEACGADALGRNATLDDQKARMRLNVKTYQNSKQFEGERN